MSSNFRIETRKTGDGLLIDISGDFDGNSAWELINTIGRKYRGKGPLVIGTRKLGEVVPFGSILFETLMDSSLVPRGNLMFTDELRGDEILGDRSATSRQVHVGKRTA